MEKAKHILENYDASKQAPPPVVDNEEDVLPDNDIRVIKDGKELWLHVDVDEDDDVVWDEESRILNITTTQ